MIGRLEKTVLDCPCFDAATDAVPVLGAVRRPGAPETGYRVFEDPAGHPFCLVHRREVPDPRFA